MNDLLELAAAADARFDPALFAGAIASLRGITDTAFGEYGIAPPDLAAMRLRFADWHGELRNG